MRTLLLWMVCLHEHAVATGLQCQLRRFDGLWHVFQLHYGLLRAATEAVGEIGQFLLANEPHGTPATAEAFVRGHK